jgi:hypothetical protein
MNIEIYLFFWNQYKKRVQIRKITLGKGQILDL